MTELADFGAIYERRREAAQNQMLAVQASNAYAKGQFQTRGQRDLVDFGQKWQTGLEGFGSSYARRGLGRSGLFGRAQNQMASDYGSQRNSMIEAMNVKLNEFTFSDAQATAQYQTTAADLEAQKMRDIMATASALRGYRRIGG